MHDTLLIYFLYDARYGFAYSVKNVGENAIKKEFAQETIHTIHSFSLKSRYLPTILISLILNLW
jgi:hypothetical protein